MSLLSEEDLLSACEKGQLDVVKIYFQEKTFQKIFKDGLSKACEHGQFDIVKWITHHTVVLNISVSNLRLALHIACRHGHLDVVEWMIEHTKLCKNKWEIYRALREAVEPDHLHVVKWMLKHAKVCNDVYQLKEALYMACSCGQLDVAKWIMEHTVLQQLRNDFKMLSTAMSITCSSGKVNVAKWLLENFSLQYNSKRLSIFLNSACMSRQVNIVDWIVNNTLLRNDVNALSSALLSSCSACEEGHVGVVKWMVEHTVLGDDVTVLIGALDSACRGGHLGVVKYLVEETLLYKNIDILTEALNSAIERKDSDVIKCMLNYTILRNDANMLIKAFNRACCVCSLDLVRWLLQETILFNNTGALEESLFTACKNGRLEVVKLIIEHSMLHKEIAKLGAALHLEQKIGIKDVELLYIEDILSKALHKAVEYGHENVTSWLIKKTLLSESKERALLRACQNGQLNIVKFLAKHIAGFGVFKLTEMLQTACYHGQLGVVQWLATETVLCGKKHALSNAMGRACKGLNFNVVSYMIEHPVVDVNYTFDRDNTIMHCVVWWSKYDKGRTRLHVACERSDVDEMSKLISESDNEVNIQDNKGNTPLHDACYWGQVDEVKILMRNGADITIYNDEGLTAEGIAKKREHFNLLSWLDLTSYTSGSSFTLPHEACQVSNEAEVTSLIPEHEEGHEKVAALLLEEGSLTTTESLTLLHEAAKYDNVEVARQLLQRDVDPNVQGRNGLTPLYVAKHYSNVNVASLLFEFKADPQRTANNGCTALHIAAKKNLMNVATKLLKFGAKPDAAESRNGLTPLHLATQEGHTDMVSLLKKGANINCKSKAGSSPVHTAYLFDRIDMISFLLEHGAEPNSYSDDGADGDEALAADYMEGNSHLHTDDFLLHDVSPPTDKAEADSESPGKEDSELLGKEDTELQNSESLKENDTGVLSETERRLLEDRLFKAAREGLVDDVSQLSKHFTGDVDTLSWALTLACEFGQWNVVTWLVEHTVVRDYGERLGESLVKACIHGHLNIAKWLVNNTQVDVNYADIDSPNNSILHWVISFQPTYSLLQPAVLHDTAELCRLVYVCGKDVNVQVNYIGDTPLHTACFNKYSESVGALLLAGADETIANEWGQTPVQYAVRLGHVEVLPLLDVSSKWKLLVRSHRLRRRTAVRVMMIQIKWRVQHSRSMWTRAIMTLHTIITCTVYTYRHNYQHMGMYKRLRAH